MPQVKSNKTNFWFYLFLPSVSDSINPPKSQDEKAERIKKIKKILYSMWNMHIYKAYNFIWCFKVQFFWEGHKNVRNRPYGFEIYLVNVKTIRTIAQIFVAFSEKLNFIRKTSIDTGIIW